MWHAPHKEEIYLKKMLFLFKNSFKELKSVQTITMTGMLIALSVILVFFLNVSISNVLRISFSFLPLAVGGMLYGPAVGGIMGAVSDILGYMIKPTGPFFPGFTFNSLLTGALYGIFLYKSPVKLVRVICVSALITVIVNLLLNPLWLSIMYGNAYIVLLTGRIVKNLVMYPINTALLFFVLKFVERVKTRSSAGR